MSVQPPVTPHAEVVLHEQQLRVAKRRVPVERVLVRRRITTEVRQVEVTVRREVLEVERAELPSGQGAAESADGPRRPLVIVLSEEVPDVHLLVRPYEQVTVRLDRVEEQHQVTQTRAYEQATHTTAPVTGQSSGLLRPGAS